MGVTANQKDKKPRKNSKRSGELSEAAFLLKARGDSDRYDFILDSGSRLWWIQLKSTEVEHSRGYEIQPIYSVYGKGKSVYTADQIDALVVHIAPCNVWYVFPVAVFASNKTLRFFPDAPSKSARWESYREAWHLLRG